MDFLANPLHLTLLIVVLVLLFGASKIGDVGGALGKSIREFKKEASIGDDNTHRTVVPPAAYTPPTTTVITPPAAHIVEYTPGQPVQTPPQNTGATLPPDYVGR
jgi:sec-independent protein translocase protein TatA